MSGHQERKSWRLFWKEYFGVPLGLILIICGGVLEIEKLGWLHGLEMVGLDSFLRGQERRTSRDIFIVEIKDADYEKYFAATSPLNPIQVACLIEKIRSAAPKVIAVDLDTSSSVFRELDMLADAPEGVPDPWPGVIWAQVPETVDREDLLLKLTPVLGGHIKKPERMAIPVFPLDADGAVRKYHREFEITSPPGKMHSLPWAVAKRYRPSLKRKGNEVIFNFAGDRYQFPIIHAAEFLEDDSPNAKERWQRLLGGKIVLLGGQYKAARDEYMTPLRAMAGVELIAQAVESDLYKGGIHETDRLIGIAVDIVVGTVVTMLFYWRSVRFAFWSSLLGIPAVLIAISWLAFTLRASWFNFIAVLVGMVIHQLYDNSAHRRAELAEAQSELAEAQERVKELEDQIASRSASATGSPAQM